MLIQVNDDQDQVHIFQDISFENSQIYQPTIMCLFKHTNHDILLNYLF